MAPDIAEVKRRADAVVREQDAIDFIDWCRDLASTPAPLDARHAALVAVYEIHKDCPPDEFCNIVEELRAALSNA